MPDSAAKAYRFAFVLESTVGHVTFGRLLADAVGRDGAVDATWLPLSFPPRGLVESVPPLSSNWSLRSSTRARRRITALRPRPDALFFHTQTASLLSVAAIKRVPTVISVDATPRNYDEVAAGYSHAVGDARAEALKARAVARPMQASAAIIAWSDWVRRSLIDDYDVDPARIHVIPAGTTIGPEPAPRDRSGPVRLLFVGGQFERKGGLTLLDAVADLPGVELDIVTKSIFDAPPGVRVHRNLDPGSDDLVDLYARADVFALPTTGDASPHVVLEAMAAGVPVVSTPVGAIPEMVVDGVTGTLVAPDDPIALRRALRTLVDDSHRRAAMGIDGYRRAIERFDASVNGRRVLEVLKHAAAPGDDGVL